MKSLEPWQLIAIEMRLSGKTYQAISRVTEKNPSKIQRFLKSNGINIEFRQAKYVFGKLELKYKNVKWRTKTLPIEIKKINLNRWRCLTKLIGKDNAYKLLVLNY